MMTPHLERLYSKQDIATAVKYLAHQLDRDFTDKSPVIVAVLKGSFIFLADLVRQMKTPLRSIEFIGLSSYGMATVSSGKVTVTVDLPANTLEGQEVVLVEDIVDTGITTAAAVQYIQDLQAKSVAVCTLLDKPARREASIPVDYIGLSVPNQFIVGYGIDFDQKYRQLPEIYTLQE